jgi:predicted enzyme related to lactoylglutathione lyase
MATRLVNVIFDCVRPEPVARFWSSLLGWPLSREDECTWDVTAPNGMDLVFGTVPEGKSEKNPIHLDLASDTDEEQRKWVAAALALGARHIDIGQRGVPWTVLGDPGGNEFCVLEPREIYRGNGPLAAIVVDSRDPDADVEFWAAATGQRPVPGVTALAADGGPPLEFLPSDRTTTTKIRVHLDVAPERSGNLSEEVTRLMGMGAEPADVGQKDVPWEVLRTPLGDEFCVLTPR